MNLSSLLNQALKSDILKSDIVKQGSEKLSQHASGLRSASKDNKGTLKTLGAGVAAGGLIGVLMGSKKTKKYAKTAAGVGGAAALGALAYKVYNDWQAKQPGTPPASSDAQFDESDHYHQQLILKAMIAAAKADGHVDEQEMARIDQAVAEMGADDSVQALIHQELNKPLDPADVARLARTPQQASEVYLASLLVADEQNFMEKSYLQELSKQLNLNPEVVQQLEIQVQG